MYWINFRLPGGKQRREQISYSVEEARDADGKRRSQKRENRIFDMLPESTMTFKELSDWYLELNSLKKLKAYTRVRQTLNRFNEVFGETVTGDIKPIDLEEYQDKREEQGAAPATIDMEVSSAKTMVTKAFDNDMIGGRVLKSFRKVKKKLRKGENARKRIMGIDEYLLILDRASTHLKPIVIMAFNTGMRAGELRHLKWSYIELKQSFIRLPKEVTKENKEKKIPINEHVKKALKDIPRHLNHEFVFTFRGEPYIARNGFKSAFAATCSRAGVIYGRYTKGGLIFHDIRRTVKTNMVGAGVDKVYRDVILGHSLKGMDVHYVVPTEENLRSAMDKYTVWLNSQLEDQKEKNKGFGQQMVNKL